MDKALAAGQGGSEPDPETSAVAPTGSSAPASQSLSAAERDDAFRLLAVEELALQLTRGSALLARCNAIAESGGPDELGPIREAARLLNANAQIAKALAQMAMVERRSKAIVETIQKPDPKIAELNARFLRALESETFRTALGQSVRQFLEPQKQEPLAIEAGT